MSLRDHSGVPAPAVGAQAAEQALPLLVTSVTWLLRQERLALRAELRACRDHDQRTVLAEALTEAATLLGAMTECRRELAAAVATPRQSNGGPVAPRKARPAARGAPP